MKQNINRRGTRLLLTFEPGTMREEEIEEQRKRNNKKKERRKKRHTF